MMRHLDAFLKEDPSNAFVARWCRQRSQIRPIAIIIGKEFAGIDWFRNFYDFAFVRDVRQEASDLLHFLVRLSHLQEYAKNSKTVGRFCSFGKGVVFTCVPMHQMQLSREGLSVHSVLGSSRVAASPMTVILFQFIHVVH